jgi:NAD kinase
LNGNYKENNLARLGARINDKDLEYLALNEILIGDTDIRHTSHLDISVCDMSGYVRGNGIVVSTKQGSNAFFKSAGATPFDVNGIGYALILPYSIDGNLEKSKVCDLKKKFEISPRRSGYKLAFDCDDSRSYDLNEEDKVEVFVDLKNPLKVVRGN